MRPRLTDRDAADVLWAAQGIWPPGPTFRVDACRAVRQLIPCDVVMFNRNDLEAGSIDYAVDPPEWRRTIVDRDEIMLRTADEHPMVRHYLETGSFAPLRMSDRLDDAAWFANAHYREYLAPLGLQRTLVQFVPSADSFLNVLALFTSGPEFTARDVAVLDAFTPTLALGCGGVTHDGDRPVEVMAGWTMLGLGPTGGFDLVSPADDAGPFGPGGGLDSTALRAVRQSRYGRVVAVEIEGESWLLQPLGAHSASLVVLARPADAERDAVRRMTARQRDVLALVATGHTNGRIAHELGIAEGTVRKHMEQILASLGAINRAAAVAMWQRASGPSSQLG